MLGQILLLSIIPSVFAIVGVDVSQSVTQTQFECLKDNGYKFVIVRVYRNNGLVDTNGAQTIRNARAAGLNHVDAYLFPCISCGDPSQQILETIDYLNDEGAKIDRLWLDIEGTWNGDTNRNIQFLEELVQQSNSLGVKVGIYTSLAQWISIMNNVTKFAVDSPLWYAHYDNQRSFNDFRAFGGWRQPAIKQFTSDVKECGVVMDRNFA